MSYIKHQRVSQAIIQEFFHTFNRESAGLRKVFFGKAEQTKIVVGNFTWETPLQVSSKMKAWLHPTEFLAITRKLYEVSFFSPLISIHVCVEDVWPTWEL